MVTVIPSSMSRNCLLEMFVKDSTNLKLLHQTIYLTIGPTRKAITTKVQLLDQPVTYNIDQHWLPSMYFVFSSLFGELQYAQKENVHITRKDLGTFSHYHVAN